MLPRRPDQSHAQATSVATRRQPDCGVVGENAASATLARGHRRRAVPRRTGPARLRHNNSCVTDTVVHAQDMEATPQLGSRRPGGCWCWRQQSTRGARDWIVAPPRCPGHGTVCDVPGHLVPVLGIQAFGAHRETISRLPGDERRHLAVPLAWVPPLRAFLRGGRAGTIAVHRDFCAQVCALDNARATGVRSLVDT